MSKERNMEIRIDTWFKDGKSLCRELPYIIDSQDFSYYDEDAECSTFNKIEKTLEPYYSIQCGSWLCGFDNLKTLLEEGHKAIYAYVRDDDWPHGGNDQAFVWVGDSLQEIKEKISSLAHPLYEKILEEECEGLEGEEREEFIQEFNDQYSSTE